jgi:hypothetical protein
MFGPGGMEEAVRSRATCFRDGAAWQGFAQKGVEEMAVNVLENTHNGCRILLDS